jgi:hypothetical protein
MVDLAGQAANLARNLRYRRGAAVRELLARLVYSVRSTTTADPVLDAEWDVLVVLDACRADLFETAVAEGTYDALPVEAVETRTSPASATDEWLEQVFATAPAGRLAGLAYVTGNPFSADLEHDRFATVEEVWRTAWDDDRGTIPPRPVTDRAIATWRAGTADRLVVHYMQPHFPSLATPGDDGVRLDDFGSRSLSVWDDLRFGRRSTESVWAAYRENLDRVLAEVETLLANLAAERVVVTADHGNAFGEHGLYGHPGGVDVPCLRAVPWCVTSGTDTRSRAGESETAGEDPSTAAETDRDVVADRLEDLGYRT